MRRLILVACLLGFAAMMSGCATAPGESAQAKRDNIQSMRAETLDMLYAGDPAAKTAVTNAPAYAVFNDMGGGLLLGGGSGYGVLVSKESSQPVYMKMHQISGALGLGFQGYRSVLVFDTADAANKFLDGTTYVGGQADAGIRFGQTGGIARTVGYGAPVRVYRIDPNGVILRAAVPVNFYSRYAGLN